MLFHQLMSQLHSGGKLAGWVNAENVLLSACLYEASAFLKAPETVTLYKSQFDEAVQLMQQEMLRDYASEYNGEDQPLGTLAGRVRS